MFNLWKTSHDTDKKAINSDEYERISKRITELNAELGLLKTNFEFIKTDLANLRGRFNKQLSKEPKDRQEDISSEIETTPKDLLGLEYLG